MAQKAYKPMYLQEVEKNEQLKTIIKLYKKILVGGAVANIVVWALLTIYIG